MATPNPESKNSARTEGKPKGKSKAASKREPNEERIRMLAKKFVDSKTSSVYDFVEAVNDIIVESNVDLKVAEVTLARLANLRITLHDAQHFSVDEAHPLVFVTNSGHEDWLFRPDYGLLGQVSSKSVDRIKEDIPASGSIPAHPGVPDAGESTHGMRIRKIADGATDLKTIGVSLVYDVMTEKIERIEANSVTLGRTHMRDGMQTWVTNSDLTVGQKAAATAELSRLYAERTVKKESAHAW